MNESRRPKADRKWAVWGGGAPPTGRPEADWEWGVWGGGAPPGKRDLIIISPPLIIMRCGVGAIMANTTFLYI